MTIKNFKKNISDEPGIVAVNANANTLTINNTTKQYSNSYEVTISFQDWENEDDWENRTNNSSYAGDSNFKWDSTNKVYTKKITFPATEIVRLAHLEQDYYNKTYITQNYYTKTDIDNKIKIHFYVWGSTTPPTVAQVKAMENYENYIFLVPYTTNYDTDSSTETTQEGKYREYVYVKKSDNTEAIEEIGSMAIDLTPYLKTANLDSALTTLSTTANSGYKAVVDQVNTNKTNITKKVDIAQSVASAFVITNSSKNITTATKIGNIDISGKLYSGSSTANNKIVTTNNTGVITASDNLTTAQIKSSAAITGQITATTSSTQNDINQAINTKLGTLNSNFSNYLLKSDIKTEIWGNTSGSFATMQNNETNTTIKNYKLGDYIYHKLYVSGDFYTASQIDTKINNVIAVQDNTLSIL